MDYQIALAPDLEISPEEFAAAWNEMQETQAVGSTTLTRSKNESFFDAATMTIIVSTASGIGIGLVTNAIYDVLKNALIKKGKPHKHTKITQLKQPDGTQLIVVDEEE